MNTLTHFGLALHLAKSAMSGVGLSRRIAFIAGSVEPDYNLLTYFRGWKIKRFFGHDRRNSDEFICKALRKFESAGISGAFGYFYLGIVVHYLSDAFTYAHNADFVGSIHEHTAYENRLDTEIKRQMNGYCRCGKLHGEIMSALKETSDDYLRGPFSVQRDARFVMSVTEFVSKRYAATDQSKSTKSAGGKYRQIT